MTDETIDTTWVSIPASKAMFCINCNRIGNNVRKCVSCGSEHVYAVQGWLDRKEEKVD